MTNRYFYQEDIATFLAEDTDTIFGKMSRADEMDTASTQKFAWEQEITTMKNLLAPYSNEPAQIIFEYTIPRLGKRINRDVLNYERAEYGQQIVSQVATQLQEEYGTKGFELRSIQRMMQFARLMPDSKIVSPLVSKFIETY